MKYYSTNNKNKKYSFSEAVLQGLPPDNGLFMPEYIPVLPGEFIHSLKSKSIAEIAFEISKPFCNDIPEDILTEICDDAFNFKAPVIKLDDRTFIAELFHGPTLAFKDFGARFMARIMSYLNSQTQTIKPLTILVATSGDTGGAVANGFAGIDGINVFILYPSGGVSDLQEKQLTTYGKNIRAIEVEGSFDDCQRLVKTAFLDNDLAEKYRFTSANSINISRLIPQMVYYFSSYAEVAGNTGKIIFTVPSGNFGNLTAGIFAMKMGLPVSHFIAATNANDIVPDYLSGKGFLPKPSVSTLSNAMDVGNPSNFGRLLSMFSENMKEMSEVISAFSVSDNSTKSTMSEIYRTKGYMLDPHAAVGVRAWQANIDKFTGYNSIILETAHPAKFLNTAEDVYHIKLDLPEQLLKLLPKKKVADKTDKDFASLKRLLIKYIS